MRRIGLVGVLALLVWAGCGSRGRRGWQPQAEIETAAAASVRLVRQAAADRPVVWLGLRDEAGARSAASEVVDRYLLSALVAQDRSVSLADSGAVAGSWGKDELVPERVWRAAGGRELALGGRLYRAGAWDYLRLVLTDPTDGALVGTASWRLRQAAVAQMVAASRRQVPGPAAAAPLVVEFHRIGIRTEGGLTHLLTLEPGAVLQAGDQLQVRLQARQDCQLWAFLYSSGGQVSELLSSRRTYADRWEYGPGQEAWVTLADEVQVYTLYVVAATHIPDDREELWRQCSELVEQGRLNRYTGLELLDQALREFLCRGVTGAASAAVVRQGDPVGPGPREQFILQDGTPVTSQADELTGGPVLIRAISFAVQ